MYYFKKNTSPKAKSNLYNFATRIIYQSYSVNFKKLKFQTMRGLITYSQRLSIHDGPGIRTVVFFKGCNMRCKWCHNPETWKHKQQLQYVYEKCINCGSCITICPSKALIKSDNKISPVFGKCNNCGACTNVCSTGAISLIGRKTTPEDLFIEIEKDIPFFKNSGGGVTLSGGEPLLQKEFALELLSLCKRNNINTAIESNLSLDWDAVIKDFLPLVDYWMCDLKIADSNKHKYWTGIDNNIIISNIKKFCENKIPLTVRTPIIPGVNDNVEDVKFLCDILSKYSKTIKYELLRFHTLGFEKFSSLGIKNEMITQTSLPLEKLEALKKILPKYNL